MRRFTVILHPDLEVGGYTVTVPSLPGCFTEGDTVEEAIAMAREAIALHTEGIAAEGEPVPVDPLPAATLQAAMADARADLHDMAGSLRADGIRVEEPLPEPMLAVVEVSDIGTQQTTPVGQRP